MSAWLLIKNSLPASFHRKIAYHINIILTTSQQHVSAIKNSLPASFHRKIAHHINIILTSTLPHNNMSAWSTIRGGVLRTCAFGDWEAAEAVTTAQSNPGEALDLEWLDAGSGEREGAVAGSEEVKPASLEQREFDGHRARAVASTQRQAGEVGARGDGALPGAVLLRGADDLQHAELVQPAPRRRGRERDPPEPELLQAPGQANAVQVPAVLRLIGGGGVHPQLEHPERGAPQGQPLGQAGHGEGAVDDQLPEPLDGPHHPPDGVVRGAPRRRGRVEGVPREEERRQVRHALAPAAAHAGARRHVADVAEHRQDVLHDAIRHGVHVRTASAAALHVLDETPRSSRQLTVTEEETWGSGTAMDWIR